MDIELFDTHLHCDYFKNKDISIKTLINEFAGEVKYFNFIGANYDESLYYYNNIREFENCWMSVGMHPDCSCLDTKLDDYVNKSNELILLDNYSRVVSVGEIGLDYSYDYVDRKSQICTMERFLELGIKHRLPIVLHCRDKQGYDKAYSDCYSIVKSFFNVGKFNFVLHCYTGNEYWIREFLELDAYFGFTGIITFKKSREMFKKMINIIPIDRILIETDAPFLAPEPYRGKKNVPKYLIEILKAVSIARNIHLESCANITTKNAFTFYNIDMNRG
jgi:TatD DNase family protein